LFRTEASCTIDADTISQVSIREDFITVRNRQGGPSASAFGVIMRIKGRYPWAVISIARVPDRDSRHEYLLPIFSIRPVNMTRKMSIEHELSLPDRRLRLFELCYAYGPSEPGAGVGDVRHVACRCFGAEIQTTLVQS
jgi:hypothetical protein